MTLEEAKTLAQQGVKMKHNYFTKDEWMIMRGNMIIFEDDSKIFFDKWTEGKDYLLEGWSKFEE
jgi:hypothetical protein